MGNFSWSEGSPQDCTPAKGLDTSPGFTHSFWSKFSSMYFPPTSREVPAWSQWAPVPPAWVSLGLWKLGITSLNLSTGTAGEGCVLLVFVKENTLKIFIWSFQSSDSVKLRLCRLCPPSKGSSLLGKGNWCFGGDLLSFMAKTFSSLHGRAWYLPT